MSRHGESFGNLGCFVSCGLSYKLNVTLHHAVGFISPYYCCWQNYTFFRLSLPGRYGESQSGKCTDKPRVFLDSSFGAVDMQAVSSKMGWSVTKMERWGETPKEPMWGKHSDRRGNCEKLKIWQGCQMLWGKQTYEWCERSCEWNSVSFIFLSCDVWAYFLGTLNELSVGFVLLQI